MLRIFRQVLKIDITDRINAKVDLHPKQAAQKMNQRLAELLQNDAFFKRAAAKLAAPIGLGDELWLAQEPHGIETVLLQRIDSKARLKASVTVAPYLHVGQKTCSGEMERAPHARFSGNALAILDGAFRLLHTGLLFPRNPSQQEAENFPALAPLAVSKIDVSGEGNDTVYHFKWAGQSQKFWFSWTPYFNSGKARGDDRQRKW